MLENEMSQDLLGLTAEIVSAHVANNPVAMAELPGLISQVHAALANLGKAQPEPEVKRQEPAVPVKKSITPAYIVCLEDGKSFKSLKRHLQAHYGLTPDQYRQTWGLPDDYPMVAPDYTQKRSMLAKKMGLGRKASA
jgi:predicted transcriptional regulator